MTLDIRKSGIPVLAYPDCDAAPLSLSLMFRFNEVRATASLLLQSSLFVDGHDDKQTFVLQYDADNLKPGKSSLGPATIPLPQHRLNEVSREGNPQIRTLSLTLKKECPVWCSPLTTLATPKPDHEAAFHQLANLAKATRLHILFDYNWLHRDHHVIFQRLVDHPEQLAGFPVWRHYSKQYRREDWSIFNTDNDNATTEDEAPVGEGPPVYAESSKRPRHVTPTPSSPPPKRVLLSPYLDVHTSPTEKNSIATPSPKPLHPSATPSPRFPPHTTLTPDLASPQQPHSLTDLDATSLQPVSFAASAPGQPLSHGQPDLQALEQAISAVVPSMLNTLLPTLLPRLLTASSPSPAPSLSSMGSQLSTAPSQPVLSALGISLGEHMTRRIEHELSSLYAHTVSHANYLRNAADAEFFEERESERLAFEKVAEVKYAEFKEMIEECGEAEVERVAERVDEHGNKVIEDLARLNKEKADLNLEREELKKDREELRLERAELRKDKRELRADKEDLRRQRRALQREKEGLQAPRPSVNRTRGHDARSARAGSAPA